MVRENYDWSADIAKLPMPVLLGVRRQRLGPAEPDCGVLRAVGRRREGAGLAEHGIVEVAAGHRAGLQPLQLHNLARGAADRRQAPRRPTGESAFGSGKTIMPLRPRVGARIPKNGMFAWLCVAATMGTRRQTTAACAAAVAICRSAVLRVIRFTIVGHRSTRASSGSSA